MLQEKAALQRLEEAWFRACGAEPSGGPGLGLPVSGSSPAGAAPHAAGAAAAQQKPNRNLNPSPEGLACAADAPRAAPATGPRCESRDRRGGRTGSGCGALRPQRWRKASAEAGNLHGQVMCIEGLPGVHDHCCLFVHVCCTVGGMTLISVRVVCLL